MGKNTVFILRELSFFTETEVIYCDGRSSVFLHLHLRTQKSFAHLCWPMQQGMFDLNFGPYKNALSTFRAPQNFCPPPGKICSLPTPYRCYHSVIPNLMGHFRMPWFLTSFYFPVSNTLYHSKLGMVCIFCA